MQGEAQEWDTAPHEWGCQPGEVNTENERPGDADDEGPAAGPDQEQLRARTTRRLERSMGSLGTAAVGEWSGDRKSTRLNSSHVSISYAVFCLKKKILCKVI